MDTWEQTESALRCANRALQELFRIEPPPLKYDGDPPQIRKGTPPEVIAKRKAWEAEMKELRAWFVAIHKRRIALNIQELKPAKLHYFIMKTDLAYLIRLAANIREGSFDRAGADAARVKASQGVPASMEHLLDFSSFYKKSLRESCQEAEETREAYKDLGEVAYMLLDQNWNESLDWANRILAEEAKS